MVLKKQIQKILKRKNWIRQLCCNLLQRMKKAKKVKKAKKMIKIRKIKRSKCKKLRMKRRKRKNSKMNEKMRMMIMKVWSLFRILKIEKLINHRKIWKIGSKNSIILKTLETSKQIPRFNLQQIKFISQATSLFSTQLQTLMSKINNFLMTLLLNNNCFKNKMMKFLHQL